MGLGKRKIRIRALSYSAESKFSNLAIEYKRKNSGVKFYSGKTKGGETSRDTF